MKSLRKLLVIALLLAGAISALVGHGVPGAQPKTLVVDMELSKAFTQDFNGNKDFDPGEPFYLEGKLYTQGADRKTAKPIGTFYCRGYVTLAGKKGPIAIGFVNQRFVLDGRGIIDGQGVDGQVFSIIGASGEFRSTGTYTADPLFKTDPVKECPNGIFCARFTFTLE